MAGKHQRGVKLHASLVAESCFGTQLHLDETRLRRAPPGEASALGPEGMLRTPS
jgi:hypothetical protein